MMEPEICVDEVWERMGKKLEHMLGSFAENDVEHAHLDASEWMRMYTDVYDICVHPEPEHAEQLYDRFRVLVDEHLLSQREEIARHRGGDLVKSYCRRFEAFVSASKYIRRITEYMHRFWIPQQINDNPEDVDVKELNLLVLCRWNDLVLQQIELLMPVLLDLINQSRQGGDVDWQVLSGVIRSFVTIGSANVAQPVQLYTDTFETKFLKRTQQFYKKASTKFLSENTVPDYMRKVTKWLEEEEERADMHLHLETKSKLQATCFGVLIDDWKDVIISEFVGLVQHDKREDLRTLHSLLSRSKDGLKTVGKKLEGLIQEEGKELIVAKQKSLAATKKSKSVDLVKKSLPLIRELTKLHGKYKDLVDKCFDMNHIFVTALDQAFKQFVNTSIGGFNMSELLSYYCDHLMRGKKTTEPELEAEFDKVVRIFCYLEDKDLFHESYRRMLSKRLLSKRDSNEDLERTMISKLKENAGFSFTNKLEGMFNDMATSQEIIQKFKDYTAAPAAAAVAPIGFEMAVQVLNSNHWPINQNCSLALPKALVPAIDVFQQFYAETHQSRRLSWVHSQGTCSMIVELKKKKHELTMSTYQACILLHFNGSRTVAVKELAEGLGLTQEDVTKATEPLMVAKHKVLLPGADADGNDTLTWNVAWTPAAHKVTFPQAVTKWTKKEADVAKKVVEVDRSFQIDAAIVRIMKMRRRFAHEKLISETTEQLLSHFHADPKQIKRRIEHLIEREYLERSGTNSKYYHYLT